MRMSIRSIERRPTCTVYASPFASRETLATALYESPPWPARAIVSRKSPASYLEREKKKKKEEEEEEEDEE